MTFPSIESLPAPRVATWEAAPEVFAFAMEMVRAGAEFIAPPLEVPHKNAAGDETAVAPKRRARKPSIATLVKRAEKTGKRVTSIVTADGVTITFGEREPSEANNPWLDDLKVTKQ